MCRTTKRPHRLGSCHFTLVRDATLKKVDSNTRKIHSQSVTVQQHLRSVQTGRLSQSSIKRSEETDSSQ